ncbi:MAG: phage tail protein [Fibrobacter sp.]|nr:phage tail protein [Fibrobacter sp.]
MMNPFKNFRFRVEIDNITSAAFSEATIADSTTDAIEYREGNDPLHVRKLSGLTKYGNITLKRGVTDSMELYNWKRAIEESGAEGSGARRSVSITIVDDEGNDKARWEITKAWPTKYDPSDMNAKGNEVVIEVLELVHEGIRRVM